MAIEDLDKIKDEIPYESPVAPTELSNDDEFQLDCHPGISCFNACCRNIDISILPYDILRLKNRLGISSSKWVNSYSVPKKQTVGEYRKSQGVEKYDEMNREWRDIILKKRSSGPTVDAPSERSLQLFDMCSYDIDTFEKRVESRKERMEQRELDKARQVQERREDEFDASWYSINAWGYIDRHVRLT